MSSYKPKEIEVRWQLEWEKAGVFKTPDALKGETCYVLDMFPYPSGDGLHVGHVKGYIATDVFARYQMMRGKAVLHPMGWDAFGLPAENYAIANKVHPREAVEKNIARFKQQLSKIGFTYDWEREINTTDPSYYRWTQWIFLQLFKQGLAYESDELINWCPACRTGLANEDLDGDRCERCGTIVEKKKMRQWMLKITDYADRLLADLEGLDWPEYIKESQRNWIGRKEGIDINYPVMETEQEIVCFTTRPDTNFGATFIVLAPEHELVQRIIQGEIEVGEGVDKKTIEEYVRRALHKSELQRQEEDKEKTGVDTGLKAINRLNGEEIPVWVSDFVLGGFGTGAVVAVPGHDMRDFEFAEKFGLPVRRVVIASDGDRSEIIKLEQVQEEEGKMINSEWLDGLDIREATQKMMDYLEERGWGKRAVSYRLNDWVFSRQRYWGEPIPLIHCGQCGVVPVPEDELPVILPEVEAYEPTGTGESPLAGIEEWVKVECPACGEEAKRETNTMPQWAGSSWYYLRYIDPKNEKVMVDKDKEKRWMPVNMYVGGAEHATRHLIYARFWHKFLFDQGQVSTSEPFARLQNVGLIAGEDGRKMSKRWGNAVNPDEVIAEYGADTLRVYEMFMGPFNAGVDWSTGSIGGANRFLNRVWRMQLKVDNSKSTVDDNLNLLVQKMIKRVTEGVEQFKFNTAIAALMELLNELEKLERAAPEVIKTYVLLLSVFAPHVAEEMWSNLGGEGLAMQAAWPKYNEKLLKAATVTIPVQINGRVRGEITVNPDVKQEAVEELARDIENVNRYLVKGNVRKVIYVPSRMINFVVKR